MGELRVDAAVVGAGFSGLYMLHRLRGLGLSAVVYEAGPSVGGTWFWNRYPGARVDIESQEYSYSFSEELERDWVWSERYAAQPELLAYLNHVADRFDLRRDIRFETRVVSAVYDEDAMVWRITDDRGDIVTARFCIMATGCLSKPQEPNFPGLDRFEGPTYHTARWPQAGVDFTGLSVGVIGTGSSAIQSIPQIAKQAKRLTVFQRTANFSVPAHNGPADPAVAGDWKAHREAYRQQARESAAGIVAVGRSERLAVEATPEERRQTFEERWGKGGFGLAAAFADTAVDLRANGMVAEFVADKIRAIVKDPATAEALIPRGYPFGAKRLCVDIGYYETYNRDNVALVDVSQTPIQEILPSGLRTSTGDYAFDALVFAIGFDAMTGALNAIDIRGRGGQALKDKWSDGPLTYLGLMVAGFPNLFLVTGPGSPSVLSNMVVSIEQHVDWISDCLAHLEQGQIGTIEAEAGAERDWVAQVNAVADMTLYPKANSWYLGANIPGKPRVFMPYVGGVGAYREICQGVARDGYRGFSLTPRGLKTTGGGAMALAR
jgi:cyclohexanone monooxygenase